MEKKWLPYNYIPQPSPDYGPPGPNAIKTLEQLEAEETLALFISRNEKIVFTIGKDENEGLSRLMISRGPGKWGLLLGPQEGSVYKLLYIHCKYGKRESYNNGELKIVSLDLSNQALISVAKCLEEEVVDVNTFPKRKTENTNITRKLAILICNVSKISIEDINNKSGFTREFITDDELTSLLEKSK